ncbi:MSMEG_0569 family flavin-dependent oxidoreductase [Methylobacterium sp. WL6]|uniref:MSMEG_0569 family flavin-dependent oxidoreductase n=1 Tax=Methylobacterium sp. WL6 TaxID=2603901 RepID=UPI0011CA8131|nr:MSMEG_0569 family flavin-dependent oxidoreductase [Methylobacterium sp. WL6]TXN60238.1 MSMEG_0569 family flavin-dependent oxidoreductase [Methylobacterium sp. WL6]
MSRQPEPDTHSPAHWPVIVVGGGQAGLAMSRQLANRDIRHVVFEKNRIAHTWRTQRWDSFCLVTPNWQCRLPDFPYDGPSHDGRDPHGFMRREEIVGYIEAYARHIAAPLREGVGVAAIRPRPEGGFAVATGEGVHTADAVVLAISGYHLPAIPAMAAGLPAEVRQVHSSAYRNPAQMPDGAVLVVGSGQSGCQIAEDLHLAGRTVHLVTGSAPRCPRVYRGRDAVDWLAEMGQYDLTVEKHPLKDEVRRKANHYLTGRDGGRDIDLRRFALEGMRLHGRLTGIDGPRLAFADDLAKNLDGADAVHIGIQAAIDRHIAAAGIAAPEEAHYAPVWQPGPFEPVLDLATAGIRSVIWATGFRADFGFVEADIFDGRGLPVHRRGVTAQDGLYVVGMPWLWTWGSGRFSGIAQDTAYLADAIAGAAAAQPLPIAS